MMTRSVTSMLLSTILLCGLWTGMASGQCIERTAASTRGIFRDGDSIRIDITFCVIELTSCEELPENRYIPRWQTSTPCVPPPNIYVTHGKGHSWVHFQILNADGTCHLFDSRLIGPSSQGLYTIKMAFPIGEELTEQNINFAPSSDFHSIVISGYWQDSGFKVDYGSDYIVQLTEQIQECDGTLGVDDGERVKNAALIALSSETCCRGLTGNVDGDPQDLTTIADLTFLIDHLFINHTPLPCPEEADVNSDCVVDIADLNRLIDYLFINFTPLDSCGCGP